MIVLGKYTEEKNTEAALTYRNIPQFSLEVLRTSDQLGIVWAPCSVSNGLTVLRQPMYYFKGCRVINQNSAVAAGCSKFGAIVGEFQVPNLIGVVTELERRPEGETAFIT